MPTKTFLNNYDNSYEQEILQDMVVESIQFVGLDMYYLPRRRTTFDGVLYEDDTSFFDTAYLIEVHVDDTQGFQGPGAFLGKFGHEIRDQIKFTVANRTFATIITAKENEIIRPREGDLFYFPFNKKVFEIKYVDNKPFFYQLGNLHMFTMDCETYEYSNERFETGIPEIDRIQLTRSENAVDYAIETEDGVVLQTEDRDWMVQETMQHQIDEFDPLADNKRFEEEVTNTDEVIDWSENNPFSEGERF